MQLARLVCLILTSVSLCACGVTSKEFKAAEELCRNNGGVSYIFSHDSGVVCNDGAEFSGILTLRKIEEIEGRKNDRN